MDIDLTIQNYRCFGEKPVTLNLREGVTALVGPNNSGKSSLLRVLFDMRTLFRKLGGGAALETGLDRGSTQINDGDMARALARAHHENSAEPLVLTVSRGTHRPVRIAISPTSRTTVDLEIVDASEGPVPDSEINELKQTFACLARVFVVGSFRNLLQLSGNDQHHFDVDIGTQLVSRWRDMKGGDNEAHTMATRDVVDRVSRLFDLELQEINSANDSRDLQLVLANTRRDLREFGAGVTQAVIVLANLATADPSYILIDEPELGLHPGLQKRFLSELRDYAEHGVVYATHSIGLARSSADWVFNVHINSDGTRSIGHLDESKSLSEFLGEMSFSRWQDVGHDNKLLLVEGPTDRNVFRHFLRLLRLDDQVVIFPLGGDSGIHHAADQLEEVKRICPNVFAIIDSERLEADAGLSASRAKFRTACAGATVPCCVLERRATENYFTDAAVRAVHGDDAGALGRFDKAKDAWKKFSHSKRVHNQRIAREMKAEDLAPELREFLDSIGREEE